MQTRQQMRSLRGSSFGVVAVAFGVAVPGTFWGCGFAGVLQVMVGDVVTI